jgi:hypothetical protein
MLGQTFVVDGVVITLVSVMIGTIGLHVPLLFTVFVHRLLKRQPPRHRLPNYPVRV